MPGVIYTISPYLLPDLMRQMINHTPQMLDKHPALAEKHVQRWLGSKAECCVQKRWRPWFSLKVGNL